MPCYSWSCLFQLLCSWPTTELQVPTSDCINYHHGIHKTLYFQNKLINQSCLWDWSKGKYLQDDSQSCLFSRGVGVFDLIFLRHFLTKMRSFCAHQKGNFLNFSQLNLLLFIVHLIIIIIIVYIFLSDGDIIRNIIIHL